jgi:hypothetical protein
MLGLAADENFNNRVVRAALRVKPDLARRCRARARPA